MGNGSIAILRDVQGQTYRTATTAQSTALDQAIGIGQHHFVIGGEIQHAFVEQRPAVQAISGQRQGHVIDALETQAFA
ncbi:hypothetical protein D3C77_566750 [compost metagenome]